MSLKLRFKFDGKCPNHPKYDPENAATHPAADCPHCEALKVVHMYTSIASRRGQDIPGSSTEMKGKAHSEEKDAG